MYLTQTRVQRRYGATMIFVYFTADKLLTQLKVSLIFNTNPNQKKKT